jgi:transcriptional regulator with XRE-family HTH domain
MVTSENGTRDALSTSRGQVCRALVVWSRYQLAVASGVPKRTLARFESGDSAPQRRTLSAVRAAFESAGVAFTDGAAPGIRLRRG